MQSSVRSEALIPPTAALLVQGGDARVVLDATSGCNKYGCQAYPDPALIALGSSTASVISPEGFAAACSLREKLQQCASIEPAAVSYTRELDRIRAELIALCRLNDLSGLEVVFAASGTDSHLIAAQLLQHQGQPLCAIMVDEAETGSGVAAALAGRHFSTRTALSSMVEAGSAISDLPIKVVTVAMRLEDGSPRTAGAIDAEVRARTLEAVADGQRVLLTQVDVSKTGMIAPSIACVTALHQQYPSQVDVLVDACQWRISMATLRAYLDYGYIVAITGSKFITGPTFSGALLMPSPVANALRQFPVPASLRAYSARADWSRHWDVGNLREDATNYGLLLRWEAALAELRLFLALPEHRVSEFLQKFAAAVERKLASDPVFESLPVPDLQRFEESVAGWDQYPTIFPFLLKRQLDNGTAALLNNDEIMQIYHDLQYSLSEEISSDSDVALKEALASRVQLGQPVRCATCNGLPASALRLCMSARMIADALSLNGAGESAVIAQALGALDKVALLVNRNSMQS